MNLFIYIFTGTIRSNVQAGPPKSGHPQIGQIKPTYFSQLPKLRVLNMTDNGITKFKANLLSRNALLCEYLGSYITKLCLL